MNDFLYKYFEKLMDLLPAWALIILAFLAFLAKWGPPAILRYIKTHNEVRDKSDTIKQQYIVELEQENERLRKKLIDKNENKS